MHSVTRPASPSGAAYTADRAAALAGIPLSTLHYWSRSGIWVPSISRTKIKRWSFSDLLALRLIDWLRREKPDLKLPRTSMAQIRRALESVEDLGESLQDRRVTFSLNRGGGILLRASQDYWVPLGRGASQGLAVVDSLDLIDVWTLHEAVIGPNLLEPRASLRIIPGKLSGEPHVAGTRIPTQMVWSLHRRGLSADGIIELYPRLKPRNIDEAINLEDQLARNLSSAA